MTHDEAFLSAIAEAPDDDAPRLVYADWLEDHGDPERAEFIRVQIALYREALNQCQLPTAEVARLERREGELLVRNKERWLQPLDDLGVLTSYCGGFWRGFLQVLYMGADAFVERGEELFRITPGNRLLLRRIGRHARRLSKCHHLARVCGLTLVGTAPQIRTVLGSPHLTGL
jgi:uncharacterized protein (TIGR02996 family)